MKRFYNTICDIYSFWTKKERWTIVEARISKYENAKCSIWSTSKNFWQTNQAVQTNTNNFEINVSSEYNDLKIWDIIVISWMNYKILNIIPHQRYNWKIDNYQIFCNLTENVTWI